MCLLFFPLLAKAQFETDVVVEPKPFQEKDYYGNTVSSGLKSVIQVNTVNLERGIYNDTIRVINYDTTGKKSDQAGYTKNQMQGFYRYSYPENEIVWHMKYEGKPVEINRSVYSGGNLVGIYSYYLTGSDTTNIGKALFTYQDNLIVVREDYMNKKLNLRKEYSWQDNKLQCVRLYTDFKGRAAADSYQEYHYVYNRDKTLSELCLVSYSPGRADSLSCNRYFYVNGQLSVKKYKTYGVSAEETVAAYDYLPNRKLNTINISRGKNAAFVQYVYNHNGDIESKRVEVRGSVVFKELPVQVPNGLTPESTYVVEEHYTYDDKQNIISVSRYVEGQLIWQMTYALEYY